MVEVANGGIVLERERELDAVQAACGTLGSGHGRLIVVDGPAGVGKTVVMSAAADAAAAAGWEVARTRGGELERDLGWGIAADLLDTLLSRRSRAERERLFSGRGRWAAAVLEDREVDDGGDSAARPDTIQIVVGLARLVSELAAERPIRSPGGRRALGRRTVAAVARASVQSARVAAGADRSRCPRAAGRGLRDGRAPSSRRVGSAHPVPAVPIATGALVAARLGVKDAAVDAAIHEVTGGNPFLLDELIS